MSIHLVHSSSGVVECNPDGTIIGFPFGWRTEFNPDLPVRFNFEEWKKYHNQEEPNDNIDILDLGFWYLDGKDEKYEAPEADWRESMIEKRNKV